jgi:hypothetical protein
MRPEIERDVLICALEESLRQEAHYKAIGFAAPGTSEAQELRSAWRARAARLITAIANLDATLADEKAQAIQYWSPP